MSTGFTKALAKRLNEVSRLNVSEAEESETVLEGHIYVAPGGKHLVVQGKPGQFTLAFNDDPPRMGVKPSADILLSSVAKAAGNKCIGVVLTGMGHDGTAGLKDIHKSGGKTFAQDAESCVVYGMPKSAVEAGIVDHQLDLTRMAEKITSLLAR
jgi:two-component system chemotaxis response regulator CheB